MELIDRNFKDIFFTQVFSVLGGLFAGIVLAVYSDKMFLIPGMLIIIPGFMAMRGNISGTFASRISSGLYMKAINPDDKKSKFIQGNVKASFFLAAMVSFALGLIAFVFSFLTTGLLIPQIILVPFFAGILSNLILNPLTLMATLYLFKKGHDPDNIMGPFVTTVGDVTSMISLLIAITLVV